MTTLTQEKTLFKNFLAAVNRAPDVVSTNEDGDTGAEWTVNGSIIQLDQEANSLTAVWMAWPDDGQLHDVLEPQINLANPSAWQNILQTLNQRPP